MVILGLTQMDTYVGKLQYTKLIHDSLILLGVYVRLEGIHAITQKVAEE